MVTLCLCPFALAPLLSLLKYSILKEAFALSAARDRR